MTKKADTKPRPRLKNLDDLFSLNGGANPLDEVAGQIMPPSKRMVSTVAVDRLTPFSGHPFRLYEGERLDDMVESIRANGVLVPILVRQKDNVLEILSGHNRVNAAKLAGLDAVPAIVLENISDAEAWIYVVETNLMQRSFSDMSHSEKAAVIATQHGKLFSQGKRNDILRELKMLENPHEYKENVTCEQVEHKLKARDIVAKEYSLSKDTVARYLRINHLIPMLKTRLDNGTFAFIPAVTLSYLNEAEQTLLDKCMEQSGLPVNMKQADFLRQLSKKGELDGDQILSILSGQAKHRPAPNRTPAVKISKTVYAKYFKPNQPTKEIQEIVEKALELYFSK